MHYRIRIEDALAAHTLALQLGGREGIPNPALVESALARPYSGYHRTIERKAAALLESVATNHGFADRNKRTAVALVNLLLSRSGYRLQAIRGGADLNVQIEVVVRAAAQRALVFDDLVHWFKLRITR